MKTITVALDAMGGDFGPRMTVPAAVQALSHFSELKMILVGDNERIAPILAECDPVADDRLLIRHCEKCISNDEKPSSALRNSAGSSMRLALDLVANGEADACVSGGNTGALMALSRFSLKLLPGIDRPALITALPTLNGQKVWMLDLGANVSVDSETLFQFAVMGNALAQIYLSHPPRVALLNVGEEEIKGNDLVKRCSELLTQTQAIHYSGYIEGHQLFDNIADVIVCDGFVGNVCLKSCEGVARLFQQKMKQYFQGSSFKTWLLKRCFPHVLKDFQTLNPDQYNGASLLGLRGIVIKSHGQADVPSIVNAIGEAIFEVKQQVPNRISHHIEAILLERHY